jgi:outer membrane protein assembly factor BamB
MAINTMHAWLSSAILAVAAVLWRGQLFGEEVGTNVLTRTIGDSPGLVLILGDDLELAEQLEGRGRRLMHMLVAGPDSVDRLREAVQTRKLGGRVVVSALPADGHLPHPDRFVNFLVADLDALGDRSPDLGELTRVLAIHGSGWIRQAGGWRRIEKSEDVRLDGWYSHWYDASGNCVGRDRISGFPRSVQWQHGPAMEDGTADGKIPRVADGRIVFRDQTSGDLVCRDTGNGLLLWRRYLGGPQNGDLAIVADRVYAWHDVQADPAEGSTRRESGVLAEFDLATGDLLRAFDHGLRAGTAESVEMPWGDRRRKAEPVPWFVAGDSVIVQAYGTELVALDRQTGRRRWQHSLKGATWFSPIVCDGIVLAAEAVYPASRGRNDGSDWVRAVTSLVAEDGRFLWRNEEVHPQRAQREKDGSPFFSRSSFKTMSVADGLVLLHVSSYQFRTGGSLAVLDLRDGRQLWRREFDPKQLYTQGSQRPVLRRDEVLLLDGTGVLRFDAKTGEPLGQPITRSNNLRCSGRSNGACTASRATVDWLMANGWLYVGPRGEPMVNQAARGACGQGVVPAHGLIFVSPTACDCGDYVRGYLGLSPTIPGREIADERRLHRGVDPPFSQDWPILLGNGQRTSFTNAKLEVPLREMWTAQATERFDCELDRDRRNSEGYLGALSAPVVGGGTVVVSLPESHEIVALNADNGQRLWSSPTGGKVDSPPTLAGGMAIFGCDDGCVYAVRLHDGRPVWRFHAAPTDGVALRHGHLSSAFPMPGSVLVLGDTVLAMAGSHTDLGGLHVWALDLLTGRARARKPLKNNQPLSLSNNLLVADTEGDGFWIVSPPGGSYGAGGAYHLTVDLQPWSRESEAVSPPMLFDRQGDRVRFRTEEGRGGSTHGWKGAMRAGGFRRLIGHRVAVAENVGYGLMDPTGRATRIVWATESTAESRESIWQLSDKALSDVDSLGALAATPDWVLVGGGTRDGSSGNVFVVDCRTGEVQQVLDLPARVVECGLAIADGRLYVACENGVIRCFHAKH